jgi:predicted MFS family arabinose efflux permease
MISERRRNVALFLLLLVYTSSFLDRSILVSLIEPIKKEFALADSQLGFLSGFAFALFYTTLGVPLAILADRYSRKNIILASLTVWSAMTVLTGFAQNYTQLALARVGVAIGEAGGTPPAYSLIADYYPIEKRATAAGIYSLGVPLGILLGFLVGGFVSQAFGWRAAFFVVGAPGLLLAVFVYFLLPEPERTAPVANADGVQAASGLMAVIKTMLRQRTIVHLLIAATLANFVGYGHLSWLGSFFGRVHGLDISTRSIILALLIGICGVIGNLTSGRLADYLGARDVRWKIWILPIGTAITLPFIAVSFTTDNVILSVIMFILPAIAGSFWLPPVIALLPNLVGSRMRATAGSLLLMITNLLGMGVGPWFIGVVSDLLTPQFGQDAIRYALLTTGLFSTWSLIHFTIAARTLKADLAWAAKLD